MRSVVTASSVHDLAACLLGPVVGQGQGPQEPEENRKKNNIWNTIWTGTTPQHQHSPAFHRDDIFSIASCVATSSCSATKQEIAYDSSAAQRNSARFDLFPAALIKGSLISFHTLRAPECHVSCAVKRGSHTKRRENAVPTTANAQQNAKRIQQLKGGGRGVLSLPWY